MSRTAMIGIAAKSGGEPAVGVWKNLTEYYAVNYPGLTGVCIDDDPPVVQFWHVIGGKTRTEIHRFENHKQASEHYDAIVRAMMGEGA